MLYCPRALPPPLRIIKIKGASKLPHSKGSAKIILRQLAAAFQRLIICALHSTGFAAAFADY